MKTRDVGDYLQMTTYTFCVYVCIRANGDTVSITVASRKLVGSPYNV